MSLGLIDLSKEKVPPLKCIFFAEFDKDYGRKISYQIPEEVINSSRFEEWSAFVLPKKEMLDKLVKVNLPDLKIMGYPIVLEHSKYPRNAYFFNLCFVTENVSHVDCLYEPIVQKVARYLASLEMDCGFLHEPSTRETLPQLMLNIFKGLNECGAVSLFINEQTRVDLKLNPHARNPPLRIPHHMVPVFVKAPPDQDEISAFDVLARKFCPWINGVRSIKQIGVETRIDPGLVAKSIENLIYYDYVGLVPPFEYRNVYVPTEALHRMWTDKELQDACIDFVAMEGTKPKFPSVFRLLCSLQRGVAFSDWTLRHNPRQYCVHERKLVQFGILKGIVRKVNGYPVFTGKETDWRSELEVQCNGKHTLEELAALHNHSPSQLQSVILENNDRISIIWK